MMKRNQVETGGQTMLAQRMACTKKIAVCTYSLCLIIFLLKNTSMICWKLLPAPEEEEDDDDDDEPLQTTNVHTCEIFLGGSSVQL
jgi:hypothetical protein